MAQIMEFFLNLLLLRGRFLTAAAAETLHEAIKKCLRFKRKIEVEYNASSQIIAPFENMLEFVNYGADHYKAEGPNGAIIGEIREFLLNMNKTAPKKSNVSTEGKANFSTEARANVATKVPEKKVRHVTKNSKINPIRNYSEDKIKLDENLLKDAKYTDSIVENLSAILKSQEFLLKNVIKLVKIIENDATINTTSEKLNNIKKKLTACVDILSNIVEPERVSKLIESLVDDEVTRCRFKTGDLKTSAEISLDRAKPKGLEVALEKGTNKQYPKKDNKKQVKQEATKIEKSKTNINYDTILKETYLNIDDSKKLIEVTEHQFNQFEDTLWHTLTTMKFLALKEDYLNQCKCAFYNKRQFIATECAIMRRVQQEVETQHFQQFLDISNSTFHNLERKLLFQNIKIELANYPQILQDSYQPNPFIYLKIGPKSSQIKSKANVTQKSDGSHSKHSIKNVETKDKTRCTASQSDTQLNKRNKKNKEAKKSDAKKKIKRTTSQSSISSTKPIRIENEGKIKSKKIEKLETISETPQSKKKNVSKETSSIKSSIKLNKIKKDGSENFKKQKSTIVFPISKEINANLRQTNKTEKMPTSPVIIHTKRSATKFSMKKKAPEVPGQVIHPLKHFTDHNEANINQVSTEDKWKNMLEIISQKEKEHDLQKLKKSKEQLHKEEEDARRKILQTHSKTIVSALPQKTEIPEKLGKEQNVDKFSKPKVQLNKNEEIKVVGKIWQQHSKTIVSGPPLKSEVPEKVRQEQNLHKQSKVQVSKSEEKQAKLKRGVSAPLHKTEILQNNKTHKNIFTVKIQNPKLLTSVTEKGKLISQSGSIFGGNKSVSTVDLKNVKIQNSKLLTTVTDKGKLISQSKRVLQDKKSVSSVDLKIQNPKLLTTVTEEGKLISQSRSVLRSNKSMSSVDLKNDTKRLTVNDKAFKELEDTIKSVQIIVKNNPKAATKNRKLKVNETSKKSMSTNQIMHKVIQDPRILCEGGGDEHPIPKKSLFNQIKKQTATNKTFLKTNEDVIERAFSAPIRRKDSPRLNESEIELGRSNSQMRRTTKNAMKRQQVITIHPKVSKVDVEKKRIEVNLVEIPEAQIVRYKSGKERTYSGMRHHPVTESVSTSVPKRAFNNSVIRGSSACERSNDKVFYVKWETDDVKLEKVE